MKFLSIIRSQEWWAHKLPPLLAIGYATTLIAQAEIYSCALHLLFLLSAFVVGAIYVSVINDITDLEEDVASGKSNRILQIAPKFRWLIPTGCLLIGVAYGYFLYPDIISCGLYAMSWIVFSLYSIKPFRLKNRGIWGVLADGCGSHVFTSLLMISSISFYTHHQINWVWFIATACWALTYGMRGILWHQFADRENDISVHLKTYATRIHPDNFKNKPIVLFSIEIISLSVMLYQLQLWITIIALLLYCLLVIIRYTRYKNRIVLILKPKSGNFQILMADYYQMIFPLSLLAIASLNSYYNIIVLIIHILLFPQLLKLAIYDYTLFSASMVFKRFRMKQ